MVKLSCAMAGRANTSMHKSKSHAMRLCIRRPPLVFLSDCYIIDHFHDFDQPPPKLFSGDRYWKDCLALPFPASILCTFHAAAGKDSLAKV